jgi:ketosteroid isomerase-like protein
MIDRPHREASVSTLEERPAKLQFRAAMEARDLTAIVDTFAPDAVLRSPFTERLAFNGHDQIAAVSEVVLDVFDDLQYTDEVRSEDAAFLVGHARIDGQHIEWVDHLRLGPDGKIRELTVLFRPLPATAVALRLIGAGLSRRKSPLRAAVVSALARPLGFMTRVGDRIGVRLVRASL